MDLFGDEIGLFDAPDTLVFDSIADVIQEQIEWVSVLGLSVLCWLAIVHEPFPLEELRGMLVMLPAAQILKLSTGCAAAAWLKVDTRRELRRCILSCSCT